MTITEQSTSTAGWTVDDSTFAARLALVRQRMGWNIKEAAIECGLPPASWGNWERNMLPRRLVHITQVISKRTGCDFMWLLAGAKNSPERAVPTSQYAQVSDVRPLATVRQRPPSRADASTRPPNRIPSQSRPALLRGSPTG